MAIHSFLSVITVLFLFYIYSGIGISVLKLIKIDDNINSSLLFITAFAIGFGIIGNILTILGYLQFLTSFNIKILLLISFLISFFSIKEMKNYRIMISLGFKELVKSFNSNMVLSILFVIIVGGYFVRSLLPPTGFDGLMYHLSTVKLYLQKGGFWDIYFNPQTDFPMLTEMHFLIGIAFGNDIIAKGISFLLFAMTLVLIAELSKKISGKGKEQFLAILIFSTLSVIIANVPNCDVDIAQALWAGISILLIFEYAENKNVKYVYIASFIAGLSVQSKIFGIFIITVLLMQLLLIHKKDFWKYKKEFIAIITIPILMGLLWYLKSIFYSGTILSGGVAGKIEAVNDFKILLLVGQFLKSLILSPWHYTLFPSWHRSDTVGPIFLIVLPFLFFIKRSKNVNILLILSAIYLLQITFMDVFILKHGSSIRYIITTLIFLCPVVAYVLHRFSNNLHKKIILLFVLFSISINILVFLKRYHKDWIAFATQKSRDDYLLSILPEYEVIKVINNINDDKKVMPIYNFSEYLIEKSYITAHKNYSNRNEFIKDIKMHNIGYVFANNVLDTTENSRSYPFVNKKLIYNSGGFYLYEIIDE